MGVHKILYKFDEIPIKSQYFIKDKEWMLLKSIGNYNKSITETKEKWEMLSSLTSNTTNLQWEKENCVNCVRLNTKYR